MATRFVYRRRTLTIYRRLLNIAIESDTYETVLSALSAGIKASAKRIARADDEDAIIDAETEIIENLLGTAFVVCQVQIAAVVQAARNFANQFPNDVSVRRLGPQFDSTYFKVEVLWALANYYKHRDEWSRSTWTTPTGPAKWTVPVIKAAGLRCDSTGGNLRTGANALGNPSFADLTTFHQIIRDWSKQVRANVPVLR